MPDAQCIKTYYQTTAVHRRRRGWREGGEVSGFAPPPPLPMFEADSQNFASAASVPRGFKLPNFLAHLWWEPWDPGTKIPAKPPTPPPLQTQQCTEIHGYDHLPVSRGYMRGQYPLLMAPPSDPPPLLGRVAHWAGRSAAELAHQDWFAVSCLTLAFCAECAHGLGSLALVEAPRPSPFPGGRCVRHVTPSLVQVVSLRHESVAIVHRACEQCVALREICCGGIGRSADLQGCYPRIVLISSHPCLWTHPQRAVGGASPSPEWLPGIHWPAHNAARPTQRGPSGRAPSAGARAAATPTGRSANGRDARAVDPGTVATPVRSTLAPQRRPHRRPRHRAVDPPTARTPARSIRQRHGAHLCCCRGGTSCGSRCWRG